MLFLLLGVCLPRNEAKARLLASRSAVQRQAKRAPIGSIAQPDPEVIAKAKRRTYTAEYKQRILEEAEAVAATRGGSVLSFAGKVCTPRC